MITTEFTIFVIVSSLSHLNCIEMLISRLFHYTSINTLALILKSKKLKFNRLDRVNDPTEGIPGDFHNMSHYLFVCCFTGTKEENLAMWNMYTPEMRGVRIELTIPIFNSFSYDSYDNLLVPPEKIIDYEKGIFTPHGGDNIPIKVEYTNDKNTLHPLIKNPIGLKTVLLGKYKREIWSIEDEYRYIIQFYPFDTSIKSDNFPDQYQPMIKNNIPPKMDSFFLDINIESFKSMKILKSPRLKDGDNEIIESLVEKYNPDAKIETSKLKGLVR